MQRLIFGVKSGDIKACDAPILKVIKITSMYQDSQKKLLVLD